MTPLPPQPSPPPSGGSDTAISPGEIVLWVSGGLAFILSFLPWLSEGFDGDSVNAWGSFIPEFFGLFPLATYVPLWVFGAALISAIKRFGKVSFGMEQYVGFGGAHLQRAFPIFALFLGMGWVVALSESRGIGMWLSVLAAIGAIAGNVMIDRLPAKPKAVAAPGQWGAPQGPAPGYAAPQPPPGGYNAPQPGYGQQPGYPPSAPQPQPPQPQPPAPQPPPPAPQPPAPQPPAPQPPAPQPGPPPPAPQPQPPAPQPQPGPPPAPPAPPAPGDWQPPPPSPPG